MISLTSKTKNIFLIITIFILSLLTTIIIINKQSLDILLYNHFIKYLINPHLTTIFKFITNIGGPVSLIITTIILMFLIKDKKINLSLIINLLTITVMNTIIKELVKRPRPSGYNIITETGYSFPSGHSMVGLAYFGYLIYLTNKYLSNKYLKLTITIFLSLLIISIGLSRIYLGVHYASDVIAGFLLSSIYLIIFILITNKLIKERT